MSNETLFQTALQLEGSGWEVKANRFSGEPKILEIDLEYERGRLWSCPQCGQASPVYDTGQKRWRHLNFFQYRCEIVAQVPRVKCLEHGVRQIEVPWASAGSGFTLMFEAAVLLLAGEMPIAALAEALGEQDTRLWRLIGRLVSKAHEQSDWSSVRAIGVDETSMRKGKRYATVIIDAHSRRVLWVAAGRSGDAIAQFKEALERRGGTAAQITHVVMDMLHCYKRGVLDHLPKARIIYDRYHVMVMAGEALELVRKDLQRRGADLKGSLWSLRGNEENLKPEQRQTRHRLAKEYKELGRALALREALQDAYNLKRGGEKRLAWWCRWANRSRLEPFKKLAATLEAYWEGIVAFFETRLTQGAIEAINGIIQLARRRARGYRNFLYLRTITYLIKGDLTFKLPSILPT
jgi:transposase